MQLLVWWASLLVLVTSVDHSKFRDCQQGSFCRRYRKYVDHIGSTGLQLHAVDPSTIKQEGHVLRAHLAHVPNGRAEGTTSTSDIEEASANETATVLPGALSLEVAFFRHGSRCGIVHISINEVEPLYPRFRLPDGHAIQMSGLLPDSVTLTNEPADLPEQTLITAASPGGCAVRLRHTPFELEVQSMGTVVQRLNARHLLNFERYREKGQQFAPQVGMVDATSLDQLGLFEEEFRENRETAHLDSKPRGPAGAGIDVSFVNAATLVGLAEHATPLHLTHLPFDEPMRLFNLDVFEYETDVPMALYGSVPFVTAVPNVQAHGQSSATTGFLIVNPSEAFVHVEQHRRRAADTNDTRTWWAFESGVLDMFSFLGPTPAAVLQQYHALSGLPRMPPLAALGKHQSRWNYVDVEDALQVNHKFDEHRIPYDFLWLDLEHTDRKRYFTWEPEHFAEPGRLLDELERTGRKLVTIVDPHIAIDSEYEVHRHLEAVNGFVRRADGQRFDGFCWPGPANYPDLCHQDVREAWAQLFLPKHYPESRSDMLFTWNDMNEPSVFDGPEVTMPRDNLHRCDAGEVEHRDLHNAYGMLVHGASVEGQLLRDPNQRPFVLTRSFFVGTHRHGAVWTGDNMAAWSHLARSVPMLLSLSLCGLSFVGADVGGFMGDPDNQLITRWHQLGIWYPFYRAHAHLTTKRREPWLLGAEAEAVLREAARTRYRMLPLWQTLAAEWSMFGTPMLTPIWYHDLADFSSLAQHADDHFFVGTGILVRAIAEPGAEQVKVHLPGQGSKWFDFWNDTASPLPGGQTVPWLTVQVPVFVREGHILPEKRRPRRSTVAMQEDPLTLSVYGSPARGRVYVDDGVTHDYVSGAFLYEELSFEEDVLRGQGQRNFTSPGLAVERLIFFGLPRQPTGAEVQGSTLRVRTTATGDAWKAELRPGLRLGTDWTLRLLFS